MRCSVFTASHHCVNRCPPVRSPPLHSSTHLHTRHALSITSSSHSFLPLVVLLCWCAQMSATASSSSSTKSSSSKKTTKTVKRVQGRTAQPVRLYVKAVFVGYKRSLSNQYSQQALIAIDGVKSAEESSFYWGKRVAYIYRAQRLVKGSHYRVIWGRIASPHGNNGVVKAKFRTNLPPRALGATLRVFMFPSKI